MACQRKVRPAPARPWPPREWAARLQAAATGGPLQRWELERALAGGPRRLLGGVDEAGRGPLAGPVVAAAVVLRPGAVLRHADDSKRLDRPGRLRAMREISASALAVAWRAVPPAVIDRVNIRQATFLAMRGAVAALAVRPAVLVSDGEPCPGLPEPTLGFPRADGLVPAVSAASVVAKLVRDALMEDLARFHPEYGFERHKGYPTPEHLEAVRLHGPCAAHRRSFAPVREALEPCLFEVP
ncbi:MAG TPA: ribonuclease HII [Candidatus Saccharimonadales bacterium]|nr:ribonuclease HII [Candidatus Saccharimonadales bacterium]